MFVNRITPAVNTAPVMRGIITAVAAVAIASPVLADLTGDTATLVNANINGGEWGFMLKQIDGPILAQVNKDYLFYPASSIKVVQHVHAMLEIETDNSTNQFTNMFVYPTEDEACDDDHSGQIPDIQPLNTTLQEMMEASDNMATNAVQEKWGRDAINDTAHNIIGMSNNTQLNHKFGGDCGGPQNGQNQMPLSDVSTLYERVAKGEIFAEDGTRDDFYTWMPNNAYFDALIDEEAPEGMSVFYKQEFRNAVRHAWKPGSWPNTHKSVAGWVQLPAPPCSGADPTAYTFGVFLEEWDDLTENFDTQDVVYKMLRQIFHNGLRDYQICVACGDGGACDEARQDPGCDDSDCCESVCAVDALCCTIAWDEACVGHAIELCDLGAPNDDCADAAPATDGWNDFDMANASNDGPNHAACNWQSVFTKDVWFDYTASCTGSLELQSCSAFETWIAIYDNNGCQQSDATLLECNLQPANECSVFSVCVEEGQTYKIRVGAGNPTQGAGQLNLTCGPNGYDNDDYDQEGIGVANQVLAADFTLPCGGSPGWLNLKAVVPGGGGPDSTFQWAIFAPTAGGGGPGPMMHEGTTIPIEIVALATEDSTSPDSFFDITFELDDAPTLDAGQTYWIGFSAPTMTFAAATETEGETAYVQNATGWTAVTGDLALSVRETAPVEPANCPGDTNLDGTVDVDDLVTVILNWGPAGTATTGDANLDGNVDVDDLVLVILAWGPCA